jgi:hypothetical protein
MNESTVKFVYVRSYILIKGTYSQFFISAEGVFNSVIRPVIANL